MTGDNRARVPVFADRPFPVEKEKKKKKKRESVGAGSSHFDRFRSRDPRRHGPGSSSGRV